MPKAVRLLWRKEKQYSRRNKLTSQNFHWYRKEGINMDFGIKGKVAIVTGTNRKGAMGEAIATTLAREGADIACVDIVLPGAEEIAKAIRDMGRRAIAIKADQSDYQQVKDAVARIKAELGTPEILVNNAALLRGGGRIQLTTIDDWKNLLKIDLDGPWYWIRETWDMMVEKKWGRIVNISSIAGTHGGFGQANYSAAKAAVIGLAKTAALEGARVGITANVVTLGVVQTGVPTPPGAPAQPPPGTPPPGGAPGQPPRGPQQGDTFDRIKKVIAMREYGEPADVANLVAYLCSAQAKYITGQDVHVMGGLDLFTY
jgi:3-oxoacyl-[acyl-carrier protein] reductase